MTTFPCMGEALAHHAGRSGTFTCPRCERDLPDGEQAHRSDLCGDCAREQRNARRALVHAVLCRERSRALAVSGDFVLARHYRLLMRDWAQSLRYYS